jgi:hypothetical protein
MIVAECDREAALGQCFGFFPNPLIRIHPIPVARELAPARLRSSRKSVDAVYLKKSGCRFGAASQPSGSKLPRHSDW